MTKINYIKETYFLESNPMFLLLVKKHCFNKIHIFNVNKFPKFHYVHIKNYHSKPIKNTQTIENSILYFKKMNPSFETVDD